MRLPVLHRLYRWLRMKACEDIEAEYKHWKRVPKRVRKALEMSE